MFKKLLANLSFNPSSIDQIGLYLKALRKEALIRLVALLMIFLALLVQAVAAIYTPTSSLKAPQDYKCSFSNNYVERDTICSFKEAVEQTAATTSNINPVTSIVIGLVVLGFMGYLFIRIRTMARELAIIRKEYTSAGGL